MPEFEVAKHFNVFRNLAWIFPGVFIPLRSVTAKIFQAWNEEKVLLGVGGQVGVWGFENMNCSSLGLSPSIIKNVHQKTFIQYKSYHNVILNKIRK